MNWGADDVIVLADPLNLLHRQVNLTIQILSRIEPHFVAFKFFLRLLNSLGAGEEQKGINPADMAIKAVLVLRKVILFVQIEGHKSFWGLLFF